MYFIINIMIINNMKKDKIKYAALTALLAGTKGDI